MELLLLLYAMLAGLTGISGAGPAARAPVALGSSASVSAPIVDAGRALARRAVAVAQSEQALSQLRLSVDARRVAIAAPVYALISGTRAAPERRLE